MSIGNHYRKRSTGKRSCRKTIIIELLDQGYSVDEIIEEYGFPRKYILVLRANLGMTKTRLRKKNEEEMECTKLEPELQGEALRRYKIVKSYRDYCLKKQIEWTMEGLYDYVSSFNTQERGKK